MAHTPDSEIRASDPPIHPRKVPARLDRRRAAWIIVISVVISLGSAVIVKFFAPSEDPYLPVSRTASGAMAPAISVPAK